MDRIIIIIIMSVLDTDYDNDGVTIIMTDDDSE